MKILNDAWNSLDSEEKEVMRKASLRDWITAITSCITDTGFWGEIMESLQKGFVEGMEENLRNNQ